jgi:periplasmic protein TonB
MPVAANMSTSSSSLFDGCIRMTSVNHDRFLLPAWGVSLVLHSVAVALAVSFAAQVKPILQEEVFKWDVALVEPGETHALPERAEPVVKPVQPRAPVTPPPPVESRPETVTHRVAPQQTVQMVHPVIEPAKPIEEKLEPPPQPKTEPVQPAEPPTEMAQPKLAPVPEPVQHAEPLVAQSQSVAAAPLAEPKPVETQPTHPESAMSVAAASASHEAPAHEAVNTSPAVDPVAPPAPSQTVSEAPVQVAKAAPPASEAKADHRWLAESLWRRVAELKRYPSSARLNGQEGKVILKAVIRSDGHLAEVSVQKSSGHQILDAAAIEAVKLACPLHMKHAIGKPEIVVSLPIVYSLAN